MVGPTGLRGGVASRFLDAATRPLHLVPPGIGVVAAGGLLVAGLAPVAAAVGVTLRLAGRPRDALVPLAEAVAGAPAPWQDFQRAQLALARRGTP